MIKKFDSFDKDYSEINVQEYDNIKKNKWWIFTNLQVHIICGYIKTLKHVSENIALSTLNDVDEYNFSFIYNKNDEYNEVRKISFFIYDRDSYEILIDSKNYFYIKHYRRRKNSYVYYKSKNDGIIPLIKKIIQKNIKNNL